MLGMVSCMGVEGGGGGGGGAVICLNSHRHSFNISLTIY